MAAGGNGWVTRLLVAVSWGAGIGLGVALGAYLTVISGSGSPGVTDLDTSDLVVVPLISGFVAIALVFAALWVVGLLRRSRAARDTRRADGE